MDTQTRPIGVIKNAKGKREKQSDLMPETTDFDGLMKVFEALDGARLNYEGQEMSFNRHLLVLLRNQGARLAKMETILRAAGLAA